MTEPEDPLVSFLHDEVERIEREVDAQLGAPMARRWSYRFTWQEVERARRYRLPLPSDVSLAARRSAPRRSSSTERDVNAMRDIQIRYRAGLNAYQVTVTASLAEAEA